jgi:hypothetical protein
MNRPIPWPWLLLGLLLLLPSPAGRLLLNLLGGLTLTLLLLPLLAGVAGWLGWRILRQRLHTCPSCGAVSFGSSACPACGAPLASDEGASPWRSDPVEIDPRNATITIEAVDVPARQAPTGGTPSSAGAGSEDMGPP